MPTVNLTETIKLDDLLLQAEDMQMTAAQTIDFLSEALEIVKVKGKRVFSYSAPFAPSAPACQAAFVRSFVHTDWIDGESVVQAGETTLEEGFNRRFHRIEDDLDALSADVARAFVCLGEQRAALARLLDEIRAEINRINGDIHDCCKGESGGGWSGPYYPFPYPGLVIPPDLLAPPDLEPPFGGNVTLPGGGGWGGPYINPYPGVWGSKNPGYYTTWGPRPGPLVSGGGGVPYGPETVDPLEHYMNVIKGAAGYAGPAAGIVRATADRTRAVVAGMQARLIEETDLNGQGVEVWSTPAGIVMTPTGAARAAGAGRAGWTNPQLDLAGRYARWAADNDKLVREKLGAEFRLEGFLKTFGESRLEGGVTIAQAFDRLPGDLMAKSARGLVAPLAEAAGKTIAREGFAAETVIGMVGLTPGDAPMAGLSPGAVKTIPADAAKAMAEAGLSTLREMSSADPGKLAEVLRRQGIAATPGEVAGWQGQVMALTALDALVRAGGRLHG